MTMANDGSDFGGGGDDGGGGYPLIFDNCIELSFVI